MRFGSVSHCPCLGRQGTDYPGRHRALPGGPGLRLLDLLERLFLNEKVDALLVRGDDVQESVAVDVHDPDVKPDAALEVDIVPDPGRPAAVAPHLEPAEHHGVIDALVVVLVGPKALARYEVGQTVPVDIRQVQGMELRDAAVDLMGLPALGRLLIPPETVAMGGAAEDIGAPSPSTSKTGICAGVSNPSFAR